MKKVTIKWWLDSEVQSVTIKYDDLYIGQYFIQVTTNEKLEEPFHECDSHLFGDTRFQAWEFNSRNLHSVTFPKF